MRRGYQELAAAMGASFLAQVANAKFRGLKTMEMEKIPSPGRIRSFRGSPVPVWLVRRLELIGSMVCSNAVQQAAGGGITEYGPRPRNIGFGVGLEKTIGVFKVVRFKVRMKNGIQRGNDRIE